MARAARQKRAEPPQESRIHDVALKAGVSTATVSRALRGLDRVRPETRDRVLAAAAELSYVPSPHAASLKSGKTWVIGVVVPFLTRWFFANLIDGADQVLRQHGYHLLVFNVGDHREQRTLVLDQQLLAKRLDGLLVLSADLEAAEVALLRSLRLPLVTVGLDLPTYDRVGIDDVAVGDLAMSHLLELGHRRIGYIGGNPAEDVHLATAVNRLARGRAALGRGGHPRGGLCLQHGGRTARGAGAGRHPRGGSLLPARRLDGARRDPGGRADAHRTASTHRDPGSVRRDGDRCHLRRPRPRDRRPRAAVGHGHRRPRPGIHARPDDGAAAGARAGAGGRDDAARGVQRPRPGAAAGDGALHRARTTRQHRGHRKARHAALIVAAYGAPIATVTCRSDAPAAVSAARTWRSSTVSSGCGVRRTSMPFPPACSTASRCAA